MDKNRKYEFTWDLIGNIQNGRPNLGNQTRLEVYRLMQFAFKDVLEIELGTHKTDEIFYKAGELAGREFYNNIVKSTGDFNDFIKQLQKILIDMKIGILRVEKSDLDNGEIVLTVSEDLDCSGLPNMDYEICIYDEGFISALIESFSGIKFKVKEIDCWCTGDRTCRFRATSIKEKDNGHINYE